jgi:phage tail sheath protein FI
VAHQSDINGFSTIAETRKDCVAIVSPWNYQELVTKSSSDATQVLINEFGSQTLSPDKVFTTFGTYSAVYGNMKYQYDKFNDLNRWLSVGGDVAGLCAQNDAQNDPWWAVAGTTRGIIRNCIKLAINPRKQNRDDLYVNAINPVMSIPGEGQGVVWGNKTSTAEPSAFDRLNVRRLLIVVEKTIATAARYVLFEFNDTFTRNRMRGLIEPYLRTVKSRRGIYDFMVVCDASNNPGTVIDANGLVVDIYLKPEKVAEFINVNVYVTRTDANFQELIGKP